jgi:ABC-type Fe3+/spermidine/putrescine transport system ATPase subunit
VSLGLELRGLGMSYYRNATPALSDFTLTVRPGDRVSLLGPSGSGKSTALLVAGGHLEPSKGTVIIDGRDVTRIPAHRRNIRSMFQSLALFPHMTVAENISFPLLMAHNNSQNRESAVREILSAVQLSGFQDRRIQTLSGGQRQRVALARAVVSNPKAVLLDEPLAALDRSLRKEVLDFLIAFFQDRQIPVIAVGHDQEEALAFGTQVVILNHGRIVQAATPREILDHPATAFVAEFMDTLNVFRGHLDGTSVFRSGSLRFSLPQQTKRNVVAIGVRAPNLRLSDRGEIPCTVLYSRPDYNRLKLRARLSDGRSVEANLPLDGAGGIHAGANIALAFDPAEALTFTE